MGSVIVMRREQSLLTVFKGSVGARATADSPNVLLATFALHFQMTIHSAARFLLHSQQHRAR